MTWLMMVILLVATTAQAEIYRWRDARGIMHYTNREDEIPARFRGRAVVVNLGLPVAPAAGAAPAELPAAPAVVQNPGLPQSISPAPPTAGNSRPVQAKPLALPPARPRRDRATRED